MRQLQREADASEVTVLFKRVVCGIDGSPEAVEAARQAARLAAPAPILLLTALDAWDYQMSASHTRVSAETARLRAEADEALAKALGPVEWSGHVETRIEEGLPLDVIRREVGREEGVLLALGAPGGSRAAGVLRGSVATSMLHNAACSVLLARTPAVPERFPRSIVVGLDGSPQSAAAYTVAASLRDRFDANLRVVVALGGKGVDLEAVKQEVSGLEFEIDPSAPAQALVAACADADLLLVGSRGLHGLRALGSVSEQVGHQARCSVLVAR